jgi:hypothetical protein
VPDLPLGVWLLGAVLSLFGVLALVLGPRRALALWRRFGHAMGDLLARVVLTVFYFTVAVPFVLLARGRDPLGTRAAARLWAERPPAEPSLDAARRQG